MSNLEQFIEKAKAYVVKDVDEKVLIEKYKELISPTMKKIEVSLKQVEGYDYSITTGEKFSDLRIHDKNFVIKVDSIQNCIVVNGDKDGSYGEIDQIVIQEENLFSKKRGEIFTEDIFVEYLNEIFGNLIG
ncbi:DUF3942 family protein [Bacillus cereus]|uniref:DUF3942 family protein n=1 Tax=Bacillus cereus TaxID=1396 RepID=UPI000BEBC87D|nr:DUF3942 family protein [Bacillus cereus]PED86307.1 hypothetical protein CON43_23970 [Bacillus cereus]PER59784.1 hypothetical protein CN503_26895 [Bacillus cereus]PEU01069.1 hypothetical protein CN534_09875 [Bacillus cereus]PEW64879.1 hypothetical protein CN443_02765 [Bacillus cereus]PEZ54831.1 hypothetical protein CN370_26755 [Bacillus cereus]